jgi:hypothetical protein
MVNLFLTQEKTMKKIAVFTDGNSALCEFFNAERFLIFERRGTGWEKTSEASFAKIERAAPVQTRKSTEALLPLLEGCKILAGGTLVGLPFMVFDHAGLHIFEISEINNETFNDIMEELDNADAEAAKAEAIIKDAKPVETSTPGVYFLDLIALQSEFPQITSKKAMMDFFKDTQFKELRLICKHVPPWIEISGEYSIQARNIEKGAVEAIITLK